MGISIARLVKFSIASVSDLQHLYSPSLSLRLCSVWIGGPVGRRGETDGGPSELSSSSSLGIAWMLVGYKARGELKLLTSLVDHYAHSG
jgi:hypothetical protein